MPHKIVPETWLVIDSTKFDRLVREVYGRPFSVAEYWVDAGLSNGSTFPMGVSKDFVGDPFEDEGYGTDEQSFNTWLTFDLEAYAETLPYKSKFSAELAFQRGEIDGVELPNIGYLASKLCQAGYIDEGYYQLHIWW